jgi:hypothetical protein
MTARNGWFEVDRAGLARIAGRRNKLFVLRELLQNAWDEKSTAVSVEIHRPPNGSGLSTIRVTDDAPEGFADLAHAYTLFAPSAKVVDATKRGRFNFGEKLVLALCSEARIETTTGTVLFDRGEARRRSPKKRPAGSMFEGKLRLNEVDREALIASARAMLVPSDKRTTVNGDEVFPRKALREFSHCLSTEVAGDDGMLRSTYRTTTLGVFEVAPGEKAHLYEMGIPVVETGDRWHVNVGQKLPLNLERDNVSPAYLRDVRVAVANATRDLLTVEDANASWGRDALADYQCEPETAKRLVELRFGDKAVINDPSDQEANSAAVAHGYTLVHGSQLNSSEWERVRESAAMLPAGRVFPTPKPFSPDGSPLKTLDESDWTSGMRWFVDFAIAIAKAIIDKNITVLLANDRHWQPAGAFGPDGTLHINAAKLGHAWFDDTASESQLDLLIHEFGHHVEGNHLSEKYHEALTKIGAKLARLAIERPEVFK